MAQVLVDEASLQDIADAIREKTGGTETFLPSAMGAAIRALKTGGTVKVARGTGTWSGNSMRVEGLDFKPFAVSVGHTTYGLSHLYAARFITDENGNPIDGAVQDVSFSSAQSTFLSRCSVFDGGFVCGVYRTMTNGSAAWIAVGV